jgi:hypothetical protein
MKDYLLACMHNNLIGVFLEMLTDPEHMQLSLNDDPLHSHKCGIPMIRKIILNLWSLIWAVFVDRK